MALGPHVGVVNLLQHHPRFVMLPILERKYNSQDAVQTQKRLPALPRGPNLWYIRQPKLGDSKVRWDLLKKWEGRLRGNRCQQRPWGFLQENIKEKLKRREMMATDRSHTPICCSQEEPEGRGKGWVPA